VKNGLRFIIAGSQFRRESLMPAGVKPYEFEGLSSGRAAEVAEMSHVEFLLDLGGYRAFSLEAE
jgi:Uncharacterised protein family (UPF0175)